MRFSVIIPCYNAAATIERALDTLAMQTYTDWEVICIDDCSKDNTTAVISAYKERRQDDRIILLRNEKNSGPGVSRNHGLAIAKGEYMCFLDADDYYDIATFQVLDEKIRETDADIVFYGCNQVIGATVRKRPVTPRNSISEYMALIGGSFGGGAWRRTLWTGVEIPAISNAEDIAVIPVLVSRARRIEAIDDLLYYYIHSNNSTSSRHHPQVSYNFVTSFHYTLQHIDIGEFHDSVEFHGIKTIIYGATLNAIKAGMSNSDIMELWTEFEGRFPEWNKNRYISMFAHYKRVFLEMVYKRWFVMMRLYAKLHDVLLKTLG